VVAERSAETPTVVAVSCDQTVAEAIELLREHDISQLPVVRTGTPLSGDDGAARIEVQSVAGSVQERGLLDQLFRNPDALSARISTVMDGPFPLVDANEEVERVVPMLASGAPAVLVQRDGAIIGVVTRADVLEYVAHHRGS
jgi:cystathionine beta-synthase